MAPDKSLAAEVEAAAERERARLIAWLTEHQVSTGSTIDREMTADALLADFIAPRLAEIAALQSRAFEDGARTPSEPSPGLLMSMAMRYDHSLGMPGYRDWEVAPGIGEKEPGRHARYLANTMGSMRQLWEEVTGNGFYCPAREADYVASAKSCGVTFNEIGRPMALPLQPEGGRSDA